MKSFLKKSKTAVVAALLTALSGALQAQVKLSVDTLECQMVGFTVGMVTPGGGSNSQGMTGGNMGEMYKAPYLDFALEWDYRYQNGLSIGLDADMWFGLSDDNLQQREVRMGSVYTEGGLAMSWGGYDGVVTAYNRSFAIRPSLGYTIPVLPKNPNSGILLKASAGWWMQKTVFNQDFTQSPVPQLHGAYEKLYDHLRNGIMLTESVGFIYMSNYLTYVNVKIAFEVSQCWSWSSRPYQIDNLMGLNGKDNSRYFDLLYGVRLTWLFPFTGKTTYDYYYY